MSIGSCALLAIRLDTVNLKRRLNLTARRQCFPLHPPIIAWPNAPLRPRPQYPCRTLESV